MTETCFLIELGCYVNGLYEIMYTIPEYATTATNKGARMAENPTGAMVFHQPPAR